jgi:hypothetical protein
MPGGSRSLPDRPNLRYLRLEAKRRLAAAEFGSLHEAQAVIAREHGQPSWVVLKQLVCDARESHALDQLRWIISRFSGAGQPGWTAPAGEEIRQHVSDRFLAVIDAATHARGGFDATASLTIRVRDHRTQVVLTSRMIPTNSIDGRLLRS